MWFVHTIDETVYECFNNFWTSHVWDQFFAHFCFNYFSICVWFRLIVRKLSISVSVLISLLGVFLSFVSGRVILSFFTPACVSVFSYLKGNSMPAFDSVISYSCLFSLLFGFLNGNLLVVQLWALIVIFLTSLTDVSVLLSF